MSTFLLDVVLLHPNAFIKSKLKNESRLEWWIERSDFHPFL